MKTSLILFWTRGMQIQLMNLNLRKEKPNNIYILCFYALHEFWWSTEKELGNLKLSAVYQYTSKNRTWNEHACIGIASFLL